ncbi:transcriptional regulator, TetR family protein [mine drainage metagenome]|uniref:Transcriptional regulator, TetR family protein n=1 Tax=mine drainage metagenome TaxID=410659 RepID=T1D4I1_9ZZZZ
MDAIAIASSVSKQTVYNHYGSKEDLFASMIRSSCREILKVLQSAALKGNPQSLLRLVGEHFLEMALDPAKIALRRVLLPEIPRFPELGQIYYRSGPAYLRQFLAGYLSEQNANGTLEVADPALMADQFIGMFAACSLKAELGIQPEMDEGERKRYIDHAVDLLIRAAQSAHPGETARKTHHA